MCWEKSFIKQAALESLKKDGLTKEEDKESNGPEGVTIDRVKNPNKLAINETQTAVSEGLLNRN